MVTCRVCQALIDISGKKDQHVVKCAQCHEATVSNLLKWTVFKVYIFAFFIVYNMEIKFVTAH